MSAAQTDTVTLMPQIREMRQDDLLSINVIEHACYDYPWSEQIFTDCMRAGYACLVMELSGEVVGHAVFQFAAGEVHILNLCVSPRHQGKGYARHMLRNLFNAMRNMQVDTAYLEVRPSNRAAIHLYHSEGFNEVGVRKQYYRAKNGREDAVIMARYQALENATAG